MEEFIGFRVTRRERELLKAAATLGGMTETTLVRGAALQRAREIVDALREQREPEAAASC